jgi:transposase
MRDTDLLQTALGLAAPWVVSGNRFDAAARRLDIDITFAKGARFACPGCGAAGCPVHDTEPKSWRHLNFFQHEAYLAHLIHR